MTGVDGHTLARVRDPGAAPVRPPSGQPWPPELVDRMRDGARRLRAMVQPWPPELTERARQGGRRLRAMVETRKSEGTHDNQG